MADTVYPEGQEATNKGSIAWETHSIQAILVDLAQYTYSNAHSTIADVPVGARVATSPSIANIVCSGGNIDGDDTVWTAVPAGPAAGGVILFDVTAANALLVYYDSHTPVTPNGGDVNLVFNPLGIVTYNVGV